MPRSPQDVYARLLLSPRGYPLWTPEPSNELLVERRDGLRIGDVGVVIPDDGGFDVFFNICLPRDHPFHRRYGVPEGFTCINQSELDIRTIPDAENPGRIISSASVAHVESAELSSDASQRDASNALSYRFSLSSNECALLILPTGAERLELLNDGLFLEQASRHGAEWYNYAVNRRHRIINHDSLYVITGLYKTRSWSVAAFESATGSEHYTAHFKQMDGNNTAPTYRWETTCPLDWRVGPSVDHGIPNQAVFIRGFKIALRRGLLGTRWISVEADVPSTRPIPGKWTGVVPGNSRLRNSLARFTGNRGSYVPQPVTLAGRMTDRGEHRPQSSIWGSGGNDDMYVEIQRVPDASSTFHPSDAINQYLLRKEPSANIAITHDSHWISILEDNFSVPRELESLLETTLSQKYQIVLREGVVHLEKKVDLGALHDRATTGARHGEASAAGRSGDVSGEPSGGATSGTSDKPSRPVDANKVDSRKDAATISRVISLVLEKIEQDAGLEEISAILRNTVKIENALPNSSDPSKVADSLGEDEPLASDRASPRLTDTRGQGDKAAISDEKPPPMAWNVHNIPSDFPRDLTIHAVRDLDWQFSYGSTADLYRGTVQVNLRSIQVALSSDLRVLAIHSLTQVGIKVIGLPLAWERSPSDEKELHREIHSFLKLDHINVLPLLGFMETANRPALVYPWVENDTLTSYLERNNDNLTTLPRLVLLNDVAKGLQYLHSQSVTHGILSGSSVLIRGNGRACISDFGLLPLMSKLQDLPLAEIYAINGARRWAAPELLQQSREKPVVVPTPESDVYSFGGIMWQVLTGKPPNAYFSREGQALLAELNGTPSSDSVQTTLLTAGQRAFLLRCWSTVDSGEPRPSSSEIVEFVKEQLTEIVTSILQNPSIPQVPSVQQVPSIQRVSSIQQAPSALQDLNKSIPLTTSVAIDESRKIVCAWISDDGQPCNTPVLADDFTAHLRKYHLPPGDKGRRAVCSWSGCNFTPSRKNLIRHVRERHLGFQRHLGTLQHFPKEEQRTTSKLADIDPRPVPDEVLDKDVNSIILNGMDVDD